MLIACAMLYAYFLSLRVLDVIHFYGIHRYCVYTQYSNGETYTAWKFTGQKFRERPYGFFRIDEWFLQHVWWIRNVCLCCKAVKKNSHGQHQCRDDDNKHTCVFYSLQSSMQTLGPNVFPWSLTILNTVCFEVAATARSKLFTPTICHAQSFISCVP